MWRIFFVSDISFLLPFISKMFENYGTIGQIETDK